MIVLGVLLLAAVAAVAIAGVANNTGVLHHVTGGFNVLGYHTVLSSGRLFAYGIALGAVAMLGVLLTVLGLISAARRRAELRRRLLETRDEAQVHERENKRLAKQLAGARKDETVPAPKPRTPVPVPASASASAETTTIPRSAMAPAPDAPPPPPKEDEKAAAPERKLRWPTRSGTS